MADIQKPATTIKIGANDPLYLSFLPALDTAMVAAWHQPKVGFTFFFFFFLAATYANLI